MAVSGRISRCGAPRDCVSAEVLCCLLFKEKSKSESKVASINEMFTALFRNDQALVVVASIVLINCALYLTFNFIIYFFKYDFGGAGWKTSYTLFCTVGGAMQILGMMVLYPLLRKKCSNTQVFTVSLVAALAGYGVLLALCLLGFAGIVIGNSVYSTVSSSLAVTLKE